MKQYSKENIRNIAVVGHGGSGKTTLIEALAFTSRATKRQGSIAEGNTVCDFEPEEILRKASTSLALAPIEHDDVKLNFLDAPGLFDFEAGVSEAVAAADSLLIVISGKSGLTVGAKKAFGLAKKQNKPCMVFVSKLDRESSNFYAVLEQLKTEFGPHVCPIVVPYRQVDKVECYIDLMDRTAFAYHKGQKSAVPVPAGEHRLQGLINAISEAVAETDEDLFEKYFSGEAFSHKELVSGAHKGIKDGALIPVLCGCAVELQAMDLLLDACVRLMPSAAERNVVDVQSATVAMVFKTVVDPFVSKLSYIRVFAGELKADSTVINMTTGESEKVGKLLSIFGKKHEEVAQITEGDIGAATKLSALQTGDTLCVGTSLKCEPISFARPCYSIALLPSQKGEEAKIASAMHRLLEEDLTISFARNHETHQSLLSGLGEQHLDVVVAKLKQKFGIEVLTQPPIVAYRETIRGNSRVQGKHKKQSGGHGQFGDVWVEFAPCDSDDLVFEEKVFGGAVPRNYFPAVEKGLRESIQKGLVAGYPMVGVKATLVDGSYHPVDSSEMSFKMAASIAYKSGIISASPILLEPIGQLAVRVDDAHTGDMMGELNKRRGRVLGMNACEDEIGMTQIDAEVPMSEMADFAVLVRQMTQGSGVFSFDFLRYDPLPEPLKVVVIAKAKELFQSS